MSLLATYHAEPCPFVEPLVGAFSQLVVGCPISFCFFVATKLVSLLMPIACAERLTIEKMYNKFEQMFLYIISKIN